MIIFLPFVYWVILEIILDDKQSIVTVKKNLEVTDIG